MRNRLLIGLLDRIVDLLDEHTENFIAERPFLWGGEVFDCESLEGRRRENELKIKKSIEAISNIVDKKIPIQAQEPVQERIL